MGKPVLVCVGLLSACDLYVGADDPAPDAEVEPWTAAYCLPQPVTRASDVAPDLRQWILDAEQGSCWLERRSGGGVVNGFPGALATFAEPGTVSCDGGGCWEALPAFARAWSHYQAPQAFAPPAEPLGEKWVATIQAARNQSSGELRATLIGMQYGSSAVRRFERRWDAAGRLLEDRHYFGESLWFTTINTWAGGRLVASRFVDTVNGTGETDYTWSWDGDRLLRATASHLDSERVAAADWSYDQQGRPSAVVRTVDGLTWSRQDWTYGADGRLVASGTELVPAAFQNTYQVRPIDDLEPLIAAASQLEWTAARPAASDTCSGLPHALTYGYPEADQAYELGWPVGDRPPGIDGDYGFGPAYDSGFDRWFGHDRVEGIAWNVPYQVPSLRVDVTYDAAGAMTSETLASSDGTVRAQRTRERAGGHIARDVRVLRRDGQELTTELDLDRDGAGRLVRRDYTMNGVLVARHSWQRGGGEITRHTIAHHELFEAGWNPPGIVPQNLGDLPADLPPPVVHQRAVSADGGTVTLLRDGQPLETRTRDAAGRLLTRTYPGGGVDIYMYEPSGELRSYQQRWTPDGAAEMLLSYQRRSDGLVTSRTWAYPQGGDTDVFSYVCD